MLEPQNMEGLAMVTNKGNDQKASTVDNKRIDWSKASNCDNRNNLWWTHCQKPRHTWEKCWKLHGKPITSSKEWGYSGGQRMNNAQANLSCAQLVEEKSLEQGGFNQEEIEKIRAFLRTLEKPSGAHWRFQVSFLFPLD